MMDAESLAAYIRKLSGKAKDSLPSVLYHYTTAEVLDKVLAEKGDLRCTYFRDLNDSAEFWTGYDYFVNYCKRKDIGDEGVKVLCSLKDKWNKLQELYAPYYFESHVTENNVTFDYCIHSGQGGESNALALLRAFGFPDEIIQDANAAVAEN